MAFFDVLYKVLSTLIKPINATHYNILDMFSNIIALVDVDVCSCTSSSMMLYYSNWLNNIIFYPTSFMSFKCLIFLLMCNTTYIQGPPQEGVGCWIWSAGVHWNKFLKFWNFDRNIYFILNNILWYKCVGGGRKYHPLKHYLLHV